MTMTRVAKPGQLKYLGFGFVKIGDKWEARPHQDSVKNFERKLKKTDQTFLVNQYGRKNLKIELGRQRLDKQLPNRKDEAKSYQNR